MVGRQVKSSGKWLSSHEERVEDPDRPPPYRSVQHSPTIVAETTTVRTEVVTTTTTTHFLSFPLWKKRGIASIPPPRHSNTDGHSASPKFDAVSSVSTHSGIPPVSLDYLERRAFPTYQPHLPRDSFQHGEQILSTQPPHKSSDNISTSPSTSGSLPSMQSTAALARASLGLGLPHVLPSASPSTEVNTVGSTRPVSQSDAAPLKTIRKSKSAQKLKDVSLSNSGSSIRPSGESIQHIRTRGLSFNSSVLLSVSKSDTKGKGREQFLASQRPSTSPQKAPKSLTRRASFWMRKKPTPDRSPIEPLPSESLTAQFSQLPVLQPISPFDMKTKPSSPPSPPSNSRNAHSRGLSRSYSASSVLRSRPPNKELPPSTDRPPDLEGRPKYPPLSVPSTLTEHANELNLHPKTQMERRPRAQTNPLLLNRLSLGFFSSSSSPSPPLPRTPQQNRPSSRPNTSSSTHSNFFLREKYDTAPSFPDDSHRPSFARDKKTVSLPSKTDESPDVYLKRLQNVVSKAEIAGLLASSPDSFHAQALRAYIGQFDFVGDPLDVALRRLLLEVGLPRETQQIDRVIEAFADRYLHCNSELFTSDDHPYILAFSLIMLHTDAFNKSNKRKMSKADYIKNTRLPGVAPQVLDCFYDNIVFVPFIFIEDPLDINGQRGLAAETPRQSMYLNMTGTSVTGAPLVKPKVDPYYLITNNLLAPLRVDVKDFIPIENPYSYEGTAGPWNETHLRLAFAKASQLEVNSVADAAKVSPFFGLGSVGGLVSPVSATTIPTSRTEAPSPQKDVWMLKLTKVGLLNRKDDILEGGRKGTSRKWKQWSVVLTGSQLLFFRDPAWTSTLLNFQSVPSDGRILFPQSSLFKPDELLSVKDTIAVYDKCYVKHEHTLRLVLTDGRHLLLQTPTEVELNEWISSINYASAFKSAGIRMRPLEMSRVDVKLTGVAAATSHLHDTQMRSSKPHSWDDGAPRELMGMLSPDFELGPQKSPSKRKLTIDTRKDDMDFEVPVAPEVDGAEQFKATFDQVKADLAAGRLMHSNDRDASMQQLSSDDLPPLSAISVRDETSGLPSRTAVIQAKASDLESRISAVQSQLANDMRLVRNIAILTPFQKSTRDRLTTFVQTLAQRVMQGRLDLVKLTCHRNILLNDLVSEERAWSHARTIALQAASETLRSRQQEIIPRVTLSRHASNSFDIPSSQDASPSQRHLSPSSLTRRSESSICESFHSAIDFGPDWPLFEHASSVLEANPLFEPPSSSVSLNSDVFSDIGKESPRDSPATQYLTESPRVSHDAVTHEKFYTAAESPEEAEQWDQTRCAQRVSLVRIPSDIDLKSRFSRRNNNIEVRDASARKVAMFQHLSPTFIA